MAFQGAAMMSPDRATNRNRDCIISDGKVYCHDASPTNMNREAGFAILATLAIVVWVCFAVWVGTEKYNGFWTIGLIGAPVLILGIVLVLQ